MKIALCQINPIMGDIEHNLRLIKARIAEVKKKKLNLVVFPELAITGYPPLDMVFEKDFVDANQKALKDIASLCTSFSAIVGFIESRDSKLYNAAAYLEAGKIKSISRKTNLPTYSVFDEARYFEKGEPSITQISNLNVGIQICEDLWDNNYPVKVMSMQRDMGAKLIINLSASPFYVGKNAERIKLMKEKARYNNMPILYLNLVGGQDDLTFDGRSLIADKNGNILAMGKSFDEDMIILELNPDTLSLNLIKGSDIVISEREEEIFQALRLGTRDYFLKSGFKKAVIGLSGGIDSSLTAAIAAEALGKHNVIGVSMPSSLTSSASLEDAKKLAKNLGIKFYTFPIQKQVALAQDIYKKTFGKYKQEVTLENLQARERGIILMEIANDLNALVLATGNKTEVALGYSTLYGDMCGGLMVIGDLDKLQVYDLSKFYNRYKRREVIPKRVFEKTPTAELKKGQVDPFDYNVTVPIVNYILDGLDVKQIVEKGYKKADVVSHYNMIRRSEYKRRQAPPSLVISEVPFSTMGRRYPLVNRYVANV